MAQEHAGRQLPTLAYDVLHRHGHTPQSILSRTEVRTPNYVAEDAAQLHEGAQGKRAPPGPSHEEERDELQALEEILNATDERWNVGGDTPVRDERQSSDSEGELAESIRQLEEKVRQQCFAERTLFWLSWRWRQQQCHRRPESGNLPQRWRIASGPAGPGSRPPGQCPGAPWPARGSRPQQQNPVGDVVQNVKKTLLCRILDRCRGWLTL